MNNEEKILALLEQMIEKQDQMVARQDKTDGFTLSSFIILIGSTKKSFTTSVELFSPSDALGRLFSCAAWYIIQPCHLCFD